MSGFLSRLRWLLTGHEAKSEDATVSQLSRGADGMDFEQTRVNSSVAVREAANGHIITMCKWDDMKGWTAEHYVLPHDSEQSLSDAITVLLVRQKLGVTK